MSTGRNRRSPLPSFGDDEVAPERVKVFASGHVEVLFHGEDGRTRTYSTRGTPSRELHVGFARAFESLTGFDGSRRTLRSADGSWDVGLRLLRFLAKRPHRLRTWNSIPPQAFKDFEAERGRTVEDPYIELRALNTLLVELPPEDSLSEESAALLGRRRRRPKHDGVGGYTDDVFQKLVAAALRDVRKIVTRLKDGRELLAAWRSGEELDEDAMALAERLDAIEREGVVRAPFGRKNDMRGKLATARHLSLTYEDLTPLLVLFAASSARNSETIKELVSAHSVESGDLVAVEVVKRRGGPHSPSDLALWEIGTGSRELTRPGSLYQLVLDLTSVARAHARTDRLFAVWTNPQRGSARTRAGGGFHWAWEAGLEAAPVLLNKWVERHKLTENGEPLALTLNRVRTTAEIRRTRAYGGHLPSAARSNSQAELYRSYLRPDVTVAEWKDEVITDSFEDVEALLFGPAPTENHGDPAVPAPKSTGYLSCRDVLHSPFDADGACTQTALICFSCRNAVFSEENLPALLTLRDELVARNDELAAEDWGLAYGAAWVAITDHILPKFTPSQLEAAHARTADTVPLRFLEERWTG